MMVDCDFCGVAIPYSTRRVAALPRPSDPKWLVAVMYGCGRCEASKLLPKGEALVKRIEAGKPVFDANGIEHVQILWHSL